MDTARTTAAVRMEMAAPMVMTEVPDMGVMGTPMVQNTMSMATI